MLALRSLADTGCLAAVLAARLPAGSLLVLVGDLGAGKTTLVQQLALALASPAHVSSPTYTLIHEYPSPKGLLVHMDAYRLTAGNTAGDVVTNLEQLGFDDYLARAHWVVVEWGEALLAHYPEAVAVYLELAEAVRHVTLQQNGQRLTDLEADVASCLTSPHTAADQASGAL